MAAKQGLSWATMPAAGKAAIAIPIMGAVIAIYYVTFHVPLSDSLISAQTEFKTKTADLETAKGRFAEYTQKSRELALRAPMDRQNKRILPERAEIAAFLQDLHRTAEVAGLKLELVEPRPEEPSDQYVKIPVQLSIAGRFLAIAKFFFAVSQLDRAISMEDISLAEPNIDGDDVKLNVKVMATTYRLPDVAAATPPAN